MRAGVLSDDKVIKFLNDNFINVWVSNVELERTPRKQAYMAKRRRELAKPFDRTQPLAKAIMEGWQEHSPVDCLVISPELDVMGKIPLHEFFDECDQNHIAEVEGYLAFLKDSIDVKFPGFNPSTSDPFLTGSRVVLNDDKPVEEVLHILRAPKYGEQDYNIITIDTTAFENGGFITIDIELGNSTSGGSFDLFDEDAELPIQGIPTEALTSVWDIPSGQRGILEYHFDKGKVFQLGATGTWFSGKGNINAFYAKISVMSK